MKLIKQNKQYALWKSKEEIQQVLLTEQAKTQHNSEVQLKDVKEHFVEYSQLLSTMQNIKQVGNGLLFEENDFRAINNDVKRFFGDISAQHMLYEQRVFLRRQELQNQALFLSINQLTLYASQKADFTVAQLDEVGEALVEAQEVAGHSELNPGVAENVQQLKTLIYATKKRFMESFGFVSESLNLDYRRVAGTPLIRLLKENEKIFYVPQRLKAVFWFLSRRYAIFGFPGVCGFQCIQAEVLNCLECYLYAQKQLLRACNDVQTLQANKKQKFVAKDKSFFGTFKEFLQGFRQYVDQEKDNQPFASNKFDNKEVSADIQAVSQLLDYTCILDQDQRGIYADGCKFITQAIENCFLLLQNAETFMNGIEKRDDVVNEQINLTKLLFRKLFSFLAKELASMFLDIQTGRFYRFQTLHYQIIGQITTWSDTKMLERFPELQKIFQAFLRKIQGACLHTLNLSINMLVKSIAALYFDKKEEGYLINFLRQMQEKYDNQTEIEQRRVSFVVSAMCEVIEAYFSVIKHFGVAEEENFRSVVVQMFLNIFYTYIDIVYLYGQQHKDELKLISIQNDLFLLMNRVFKYGILKYDGMLKILDRAVAGHYESTSLKDLVSQDRRMRQLSFDEHLLQPDDVRKAIDVESIKAKQSSNLGAETLFAQLQAIDVQSMKQHIQQLFTVSQRASRVLLCQFEKAIMPHFRAMIENLLATIIEQSAVVFIGQKQLLVKDLGPLFEQYLANELGVLEQRKAEKILNITSINQILIRYLDNYQRYIMQFIDQEVQVFLIQDIQVKTCVIIKMLLAGREVNEMQAYSISIVFGYIIKCLKMDTSAVFPKIIINQKETSITSVVPQKIVAKIYAYLDQIFAGYLI